MRVSWRLPPSRTTDTRHVNNTQLGDGSEGKAIFTRPSKSSAIVIKNAAGEVVDFGRGIGLPPQSTPVEEPTRTSSAVQEAAAKQRLFDALSRTMPTKLDGDRIIVSGVIGIEKPYKPADVRLMPGAIGGHDLLLKIRRVVDMERNKYNLRMSKNTIDQQMGYNVDLKSESH